MQRHNRQWGAIYQYLGKDEQLNENRLIADHLSVYRQANYTVFSESEAEDKIFETFSKHPENTSWSRLQKCEKLLAMKLRLATKSMD